MQTRSFIRALLFLFKKTEEKQIAADSGDLRESGYSRQRVAFPTHETRLKLSAPGTVLSIFYGTLSFTGQLGGKLEDAGLRGKRANVINSNFEDCDTKWHLP